MTNKANKQCNNKIKNMMRTYNMTGSFVTTAARLSINSKQTINANNVKITCYVWTVIN